MHFGDSGPSREEIKEIKEKIVEPALDKFLNRIGFAISIIAGMFALMLTVGIIGGAVFGNITSDELQNLMFFNTGLWLIAVVTYFLSREKKS